MVPVPPDYIRAYVEETGFLSWSSTSRYDDEFGFVMEPWELKEDWDEIIERARKGEIRVTRTVTLEEGEERLALTATEQVALF